MADSTKKERAERPSAHADVKPLPQPRVVNGRVVVPTLADAGMEEKILEAEKKLFPSRDAAIEHFRKKGMLTRAGKLTKAYGGK